MADLAPVGRSAHRRLLPAAVRPRPSASCDAWFVDAGAARGLRRRDRRLRQPDRLVGPGPAPADPAVLTGSHLDSVLDGGAYDGPLGVVSALAAVDLLRERGFVPTRPIGVGGVRRGGGLALRAGLPRVAARDRRVCRGTRRRELRDRDGVASPTRWRRRARRRRAGPRSTCSTASAASSSCTSSRAATSSTAARRSGWRAGSGRTGATASTSPARPTTPAPRGWRTGSDPMLTYAMTALAANKQARLAGQRATFGRVEVDAQRHQRRAVAGDRLAGRAGVVRRGPGRAGRRGRRGRPSERAERDGTSLTVTAESVSGAGRLRRRPRRAGSPPTTRAATGRSSRPQAGHDAGILVRGRASRPRCSSSATRPASPTRPTSTPRSPTAWPASHALADTLERLARDDASYLLERAWVDGAVHDDVLVEIEDGRFTSVGSGDSALLGRARPEARFPRSPGTPTRSPASPSPAWPTATATRSTGRCGGGPSGSGARSGPGASRCTPSRRGSTPTPTSRWRGRRTARWSRPGSRAWGSSTTCTTSPTGRRTTTRTRWATRSSQAARGGRDPDHAARHLLPQQRVRRAAPRACSCGSATATPTRGPSASAASQAADGAGSGRRSTPSAPCRATSCRSSAAGPPLHVHLSEQVAENEACLAAYGVTPDPAARTTRAPSARHHASVHATHLTDDDVALLGGTRTVACFCPTTERDLGDGIGPSRAAARRRRPAHARQRQPRGDRPVRGDARGSSSTSGWPPSSAATGPPPSCSTPAPRHASLGFDDAGAIAVGQRGRPGHRRHRPARAPRAPAPTSTPRSSPPPPPTSPRSSSTAGSSFTQGDRRARSAATWPPRSEDCGHDQPPCVTNIGELVTNDPERRRPPRHRRATPRSSSRAAGSPGSAAADDAPAADEQVDAGGRAVLPGFVDCHSPPGLRRRPGAGVRRPDGRGALRRRRHPHHRRRHPRGHRRAAHRPRRPAGRRRCAARARPRSRSRAATGSRVHDEARSLAVARQFTEETTFLGAHVVPAEHADDPAAYVDLVTGPMLEAAAPHARWIDVVLRGRRLRRRPGPRRPRGRRGRRAARAAARQPARLRRPASGWPPSSG